MKKDRKRQSDYLREVLEEKHERMWRNLLLCRERMDALYFEMLCRYLLQYILCGTILDFENPIMQDTLCMFRKMVDREVDDVRVDARLLLH